MSRADVTTLREKHIREISQEPWGEAAAVAVLLGFERITGDNRFEAHVDQTGVHWDEVLADGTWSPSERFLIASAAALWNGRNGQVDLSRVSWLDDRFWRVWHDMVIAARTGRIPARHEEETES